MRISVQACIEGEGERPAKVFTLGVLEREDGFAPSAGLGLFLRETQTLLKQLGVAKTKGAPMKPPPVHRTS